MEAHSAAAGGGGDDGLSADDVFAWLLMDDDEGTSGGELLNLLDEVKEDESMVESESSVGRVRFIDDPYSSLLVFQSSSSYITINGNEESCGSSFSDSFTSVMASVDTNGLRRRKMVAEEDTGACASNNEIARDEEDGPSDMVFDCEWDDEVLARFLGGEEGDGVFN